MAVGTLDHAHVTVRGFPTLTETAHPLCLHVLLRSRKAEFPRWTGLKPASAGGACGSKMPVSFPGTMQLALDSRSRPGHDYDDGSSNYHDGLHDAGYYDHGVICADHPR